MVVSLKEMKNYMRVEFDDDDALIRGLIEQSQNICMDVARITDEDEFEEYEVAKTAVLYTVAYLYEHREDANHNKLLLDLRALLHGMRNPAF